MGTANISGKYEGYFNIVMRPSANMPGSPDDLIGKLMAFSGSSNGALVQTKITFDFDNKLVTVEDVTLTPSTEAPMDTQYVYWKARGDDAPDSTDMELPIEDQGDGIYKITYWLTLVMSSSGTVLGPQKTDIRLEISQLRDGSIAFVTYVADTDEGNWIPGTALPSPPFPPLQPMPDWRGRADKVESA